MKKARPSASSRRKGVLRKASPLAGWRRASESFTSGKRRKRRKQASSLPSESARGETCFIKLGGRRPGQTRPLGIPSINDRIVQEVLKSILEPIFERNFLETSHGFRPRRGCHTALKTLNTRHKDGIWFIEGDIKNYFNTINHGILLSLLKKRVQDPLVLDLIASGLKAKVFQEKGNSYFPEVGAPQGGILSPLLSNIYLHELDKYMRRLGTAHLGPVDSHHRKQNPAAYKLLRTGKKSEYYRKRIPSRIPREKGYRNVKYIRSEENTLSGEDPPVRCLHQRTGRTSYSLPMLSHLSVSWL